MKGRQIVLTLLFTLFSGLCLAAGIFIRRHESLFAGDAAGFFRMALLLFIFFLIPTTILWIKMLKP